VAVTSQIKIVASVDTP